MKKFLLLGVLGLIMLAGCSNNKQEIELGKEQIEQQENSFSGDKADQVKLTISRIGGSLSRDVEIIGDGLFGIESIPVEGENYIRKFFNNGGDMLTVDCNEGYIMSDCKAYGPKDNVEEDNVGCRLINDNPDFLRTSMIVECTKQ